MQSSPVLQLLEDLHLVLTFSWFKIVKTMSTFSAHFRNFLAEFLSIFRHCLARFVQESWKKCLDLQESCKKRLNLKELFESARNV